MFTDKDAQFKSLMKVPIIVCAYPECNINWREHSKFGITFHRFPAETHYKMRWVEVIRQLRQDRTWYPSQDAKLCNLHFKEHDFYYIGSKRHVRQNSLPRRIVRMPEFMIAMGTKVRASGSVSSGSSGSSGSSESSGSSSSSESKNSSHGKHGEEASGGN